MPSRQEIIAYATEVAKKYGLDPEVFLAVINGESGFNPAAVGDNGQSFGLGQLYMGGGLGNVYEQQYGKRPDDPGDWRTHLDFTARQVAQGGQGYGPWHAAKRAGIGQFQGVPGHNQAGTPGAPGQRDRGVTQQPGSEPLYQPMAQGGQSNMMDLFKQWQDKPEPLNVLGALTNAAGWTQPGDKKTTVMGALFNSFKKEPTKLEQQVADLNHMAPMSDKAQLDAKLKPKQQTVAGALLGRKPASAAARTEQQGPTLMSMLGQAKKADAAAAAANGVAPTPLATLFRMFV